MSMTQTKKNVFIGVLTGTLVGFVLGVVFGMPGTDFETALGTGEGNASGNIAKIANIGKFTGFPAAVEESASKDTIRYEAVDEDGKSMEILIIK